MTPELFLDGLRRGDSHDGGIRCLRLFRVEPDFFMRLRSDVERLCALRSPSRPSAKGHVTGWTAPSGTVTQFSLLNRSGRSDDFSADHDLSCEGKWFYDAAIAPALDELISAFPHLVNFRVNVLGPGASLSAHEEHVIFRARDGKPAARLRFHLPIDSNAGCRVTLDGASYGFEAGCVYLFNQGCVHAARNDGEQPRTHLVWDALLTERLFEFLFLQPSPEFLARLSAREPAPLATGPVGPYRRLPPLVSCEEAAALWFCQPQ